MHTVYTTRGQQKGWGWGFLLSKNLQATVNAIPNVRVTRGPWARAHPRDPDLCTQAFHPLPNAQTWQGQGRMNAILGRLALAQANGKGRAATVMLGSVRAKGGVQSTHRSLLSLKSVQGHEQHFLVVAHLGS